MNEIFRLIDANLNRLKEGIRVVEDIERYIFNNQPLSLRLKQLRHQATYSNKKLLKYRDIKKDVLKESIESEKKRATLEEIMSANIKRSQEASRVLEEAFKLIDSSWSERFKKIRYELYDIEKELSLQKTLHHSD
ncbi:MAG: thiamine-phosphate pyrophosphorylase [Epsilonproteobacteria bacterium]|nr:thiamine-phosphate pyrophosphorylase [Campylobacterota bacterium]